MTGSVDDAQTEDVPDYSIPVNHPFNHGVGLPVLPPPARHHRSCSSVVSAADQEPSPNQVRRSKRQPMAVPNGSVDLLTGSANSVGQVLMPSSSGISQRGIHSTPGSTTGSPTHAVPLRSPRMGRKSLRAYQPQQQQQQPPLYENQTYTPSVENLSLKNDSIPADTSSNYQGSSLVGDGQDQSLGSATTTATNVPCSLEGQQQISLQGLSLEQLLAKVASGAVDPLLTKQVLDKLLEAAMAAKIIQPPAQLPQPVQQQQQQPQQQQEDVTPAVIVHRQEEQNVNNGRDAQNGDDGEEDDEEEDEEEEESPAESSSSPVTEGLPRKSNLLIGGRSKSNGADSRQLSVRFDPKQVWG